MKPAAISPGSEFLKLFQYYFKVLINCSIVFLHMLCLLGFQ